MRRCNWGGKAFSLTSQLLSLANYESIPPENGFLTDFEKDTLPVSKKKSCFSRGPNLTGGKWETKKNSSLMKFNVTFWKIRDSRTTSRSRCQTEKRKNMGSKRKTWSTSMRARPTSRKSTDSETCLCDVQMSLARSGCSYLHSSLSPGAQALLVDHGLYSDSKFCTTSWRGNS